MTLHATGEVQWARKVFKNNSHGGKNLVLLIPAHWAEAHSAEVCAKHLDTRPETLPVLSDSPAKQSDGVQRTKEEGRLSTDCSDGSVTSKTRFSGHQNRYDHHFFFFYSKNHRNKSLTVMITENQNKCCLAATSAYPEKAFFNRSHLHHEPQS